MVWYDIKFCILRLANSVKRWMDGFDGGNIR